MTTSNPCPKPFDIWLAKFRFLDKPTVTKIRPVVILEVDAAACLIVILKVTSHEARTVDDLELKHWKEAGLRKPSVVRCSQMLKAPYSVLQREKPFGRLNEEDIRSLKEQVSADT